MSQPHDPSQPSWQGGPQPYPPPGGDPNRPSPTPHRHRRVSWKLLGAAALALVIGVAIGATSASGSTKTKTVAGPTTHVTTTATETATATVHVTTTPTKVVATRTRTATVTHAPHYSKYGEGIYVVGKDIKPGRYHTGGGSLCYWARLSSLNTSDIIDNSNITGPQTIEVGSGDAALEIDGDCTFGRA